MRYILLLLLPFQIQALELQDLSIEYKHAVGTNRHWNIPQGEVKKGELNFNIETKGDYIFSTTRIKTMLTRQFRYGALEQEVGLYKDDYELFLHHESEHALDYEYDREYPNQNSVGFRVKLN